MASPAQQPAFKPGDRVDYRGTHATVRFSGPTLFATGIWIGLELFTADGKNDGSVNGERYFTCPPQHGLFVRPSQLKAAADAASSGTLDALPTTAVPPSVPKPSVPPTPAASRTLSALPGPSVASTPAVSTSRAAPVLGTARKPPPADLRTSLRSALLDTKPAVVGSAPLATPAATRSARLPVRATPGPISPSVAGPEVAINASGSKPVVTASSTTSRIPGTTRPTPSRVSPLLPRDGSPALSSASASRSPHVGDGSQITSPDVASPRISSVGSVDTGLDSPALPTPVTDGGAGVADVAADALPGSSKVVGLGLDLQTPEHPSLGASSSNAEIESDIRNEELPEKEPTDDEVPSSSDPVDIMPPVEESHQETQTSQDLTELDVETVLPPPPWSHALMSPKGVSQPTNMRELEELRVRVRVMERQREEDLQRLAELERLRTEVELLDRDKSKLHSKVTELQTSLGSLRDELKTVRDDKNELERKLEDANENLESMTLDKEVAEEKADVLSNEVVTLKERVEELQMELEIMAAEREEASGLEPGAPKDSAAEIRDLKKQIDVLKEALVKLRDINNDNETERKKRIQALEREVVSLAPYKMRAEELAPQLEAAQEALQTLKEQLDDALDAEDMVMQLTEKNLALGEKIEELRAANEDLEALKELSDELEENHVETERQLQEAIIVGEAQIRDLQAKLEDAAETVADYERTIDQFRTLVRNLQADVETLQASSSMQLESERHLSSQSQTMMSLTIRLQNTASDMKAKQVELDLRRLEALEAAAKVKLMEPYVPDAVVEKDANSMACQLAVSRLRQKAELVEKYVDQEQRSKGNQEKRSVAVADLRHGLRYFAGLCLRFENFMDICSVDEFLELGKLGEELIGSERRLDNMLDLSKEQTLTTSPQALVDLQRCIAQMDSLSTAYLERYILTDTFVRYWTALLYVEGVETLTDRLDASIEALETCFMRQKATDEDSGNVSTDVSTVLEVAKTFIGTIGDDLRLNVTSIRQGARKLQQRVAALAEQENSLVPTADIVEQLIRLFNHSTRAVDFFRQLTAKIDSRLKTETGESTGDVLLKDLQKLLLDCETQVFKLGEEPAWTGTRAFLESLESATTAALEEASSDDAMEVIERVTSPRVVRGTAIKEQYLLNVRLQKEAKELADQVSSLTLALKKRDETVQESSVRIQLLEKRMGDSKEQAEAISTLEAELAKSREQEGIFERAVEELQAEVDQLQQENAQLKRGGRRVAGGGLRSGTSTPTLDDSLQGNAAATSGDAIAVALQAELASAGTTLPVSAQVEALRTLVRYLRLENARLIANAALLGGIHDVPVADGVSAPMDPLARRMARLAGRASTAAGSEQTPRPQLVLAEVRNALSAPKMVDLSTLVSKPEEVSEPKPSRSLVRWMPRMLDPVQQYRDHTKHLQSVLNQAKNLSSALPRTTRRRQARRAANDGVHVGRLCIPGGGSGEMKLTWQGLESVHRMIVAA